MVVGGHPKKPLHWVGSSYDDLMRLSDDLKSVFGFALKMAQAGEKHEDAKPLKGFGGTGVLEVVADDAGGTYRAVYTVMLPRAVYVLRVFEKKSKRGIETPRREMEMVRRRLTLAQQDHEERYE